MMKMKIKIILRIQNGEKMTSSTCKYEGKHVVSGKVSWRVASP